MRDRRGRSSSSSPRTSCQRRSTSRLLVKKRWPPRSKRKPSRTSVRASPPTMWSASKTTTRWPAWASMYPAVSPAGPAPSTATDLLIADGSVSSSVDRCCLAAEPPVGDYDPPVARRPAAPFRHSRAAGLRLTVVVPATDHPPTLSSCLDAIGAATHPPEELIVVDTPRGAGPAEARNIGNRRASGDVLVFVDSDVAVHRNAFSRMRERFDG